MPTQSSIDRVPHSTDAERTVLGALLIDSEKLLDVFPKLAADDFYDPVHRAIFAAMIALHLERKPIDIVTLADALKGQPELDRIGASVFLATIAADVPTASHAERYAEIVTEHAQRRRIKTFGETLVEFGRDDRKTSAELMEFAEQRILSLSHQPTMQKPQYLAELTDVTYERYAALQDAEEGSPLFGIKTGFPKLDDKLAGLHAGDLMVIAARPSMGKTAFALDIARNVAAVQGKNVVLFSLEMTRPQIMDRLIAGYLGIETWKLKKGKMSDAEFSELGKVFDRIAQYPIAIDDDPDTRLQNLWSKARRHQMERGIDLLIIDYLQLIEVTDRAASENRTQQVSFISKRLKQLARDLQCPVIALSQLSRSCEQRSPPIPQLSDIRESGAIEQDADSVVMLYRQGFYDPDCDDPFLTDLFLRKNRNGPTGIVSVRFQPQHMTFQSM